MVRFQARDGIPSGGGVMGNDHHPERDEDLLSQKRKQIACPVCGKPMSEKYLPDKKGFIDERLYYFDDFRVIANTVLECDFYHFYDEEEDRVLEEPHELVAVVNVAFDKLGTCTAFDIIEIHPTTQSDSANLGT